jgi:hypothetical protein
MNEQTPSRLARKVAHLGLAFVAAVAVVVGVASPAYANFPHFKTASVSLAGSSSVTARSATSSGSHSAVLPDLLYTWSEMGLGNPDVVYRISTVVTATFGCANGDGKRPSASCKIMVTVPVSVEVASDKNGRINGSVVLDTSSVSPIGFSCPRGKTLVALSATFTNNTITDTTNGVSATAEDVSVILGP